MEQEQKKDTPRTIQRVYGKYTATLRFQEQPHNSVMRDVRHLIMQAYSERQGCGA